MRPPEEERANILMVDDQEQNLVAMEAILKDLGQNLVRARSGEEALKALFDREFAVVLLDVRMSGMDGFETADLIRRRPKSRHTPIIFVTAVDDRLEHVSRGYAVGGVDYILKPIQPEILRSKVKVFVELFQKTRSLEREIAERRKVEESLVKSRDFYLTLFNEFPTLIWRTGTDGKCNYVNRCWLAFVGRNLTDERGDGWTESIHPEDVERFVAAYREAFAARRPFEAEVRLRRHDGDYRWLLNVGRPYSDLEGQFAGFVGSCYDVTERRRQEEETREAYRELEAFSYSVSHDLRAPLRSIAGFSEALIEDYGEQLDAAGKDYAQRVVASAKQMDTLIRDLLTFSRIAREKVAVVPLDPEPVLREARDQLDCRKGEIRIATSFPSVLGNGVLLAQVFANLFSNAVKFVPRGVVPAVVVRAEEKEGWVRFWVEDNGIGIAPEYHDRIFGVFERINPSEEFPGTGIGLAIVRRAVDRMGGRVGLLSAPGQGSRFWIELPPANGQAGP